MNNNSSKVLWYQVLTVVALIATIASCLLAYYIHFHPEKNNNSVGHEQSLNQNPKPRPIGTKIENFIAYSDGTALDTLTDKMWMRCSLGQEWDSVTCKGEPIKVNWKTLDYQLGELNKKRYLGYEDWRIPSVKEMNSIMFCSNGFEHDSVNYGTSNNIDLDELKSGCKGNGYMHPSINPFVFPNSYFSYWTSTKTDDNKYIYSGDFHNSRFVLCTVECQSHFRAVR